MVGKLPERFWEKSCQALEGCEWEGWCVTKAAGQEIWYHTTIICSKSAEERWN